MPSDNHEIKTINKWKQRGLILKEDQTYNDIYSYVMSIERCERCGINFDDDIHNNKRCMDHNHRTGHFRQVLCHRCNITLKSKIYHLWISVYRSDQYKVNYYFRYKRTGFKTKTSS